MWTAIGVPSSSKCDILSQRDRIIDGHAEAARALLHIEPTENVDDAHHHVVDDLLPLGHTEVCLTLNDPESHDTPKTQKNIASNT